MNKDYILPFFLILVANIVFWFKGQAKDVFDIHWSPFQWWLYTSLFTNYMTLIAWWRLVELGDVWKASVTWSLCSLAVELVLNTIFISFSWKGVFALLLCGLAGVIAHS